MPSNISLNPKLVVTVQTVQTPAAAPAQQVVPTAGGTPESAAAPDKVVEVITAVVADSFGATIEAPAPAALTGTQVTLSAARLASDLSGLLEAGKLPEQMQYDLSVQLTALMGAATLPREAKATRLMEFMAPYAEQLAKLAQKQPLTADQRKSVADQLLKHMNGAGLARVVETTTQRTGAQVGFAMMSAHQPEDVRKTLAGMRFDSNDPSALIGAATPKTPGVPQPVPSQQPQIAASTKPKRSEDDEPDDSPRERARKKNGALWGMLHKGRSEMGRIDDDDKWVPDDKALYAAGLTALVISLGIAALLTVFR